MLFSLGMMLGSHIMPAREHNNLLQSIEMYSNKVSFIYIQMKSLLKIMPI